MLINPFKSTAAHVSKEGHFERGGLWIVPVEGIFLPGTLFLCSASRMLRNSRFALHHSSILMPVLEPVIKELKPLKSS